MAVREVLSSSNRGTGRFESISLRVDVAARSLHYSVRMTQTARENTNNTFNFYLYGSSDNFVTRRFLGAVEGWRGGMTTDKLGNLVPMSAPAITLEMTPELRALDILAEIESGNSVRFALDAEDA